MSKDSLAEKEKEDPQLRISCEKWTPWSGHIPVGPYTLVHKETLATQTRDKYCLYVKSLQRNW